MTELKNRIFCLSPHVKNQTEFLYDAADCVNSFCKHNEDDIIQEKIRIFKQLRINSLDKPTIQKD